MMGNVPSIPTTADQKNKDVTDNTSGKKGEVLWPEAANLSMDSLEPSVSTYPGETIQSAAPVVVDTVKKVNPNGYYDNSLVTPVSVEFEYLLHHDLLLTEGEDGLVEYMVANSSHISMKQPLLREIAHAALGFVCFYTLEIIEDTGGGDQATVTTGLSEVSFSATFGYIDVNVERYVRYCHYSA